MHICTWFAYSLIVHNSLAGSISERSFMTVMAGKLLPQMLLHKPDDEKKVCSRALITGTPTVPIAIPGASRQDDQTDSRGNNLEQRSKSLSPSSEAHSWSSDSLTSRAFHFLSNSFPGLTGKDSLSRRDMNMLAPMSL